MLLKPGFFVGVVGHILPLHLGHDGVARTASLEEPRPRVFWFRKRRTNVKESAGVHVARRRGRLRRRPTPWLKGALDQLHNGIDNVSVVAIVGLLGRLARHPRLVRDELKVALAPVGTLRRGILVGFQPHTQRRQLAEDWRHRIRIVGRLVQALCQGLTHPRRRAHWRGVARQLHDRAPLLELLWRRLASPSLLLLHALARHHLLVRPHHRLHIVGHPPPGHAVLANAPHHRVMNMVPPGRNAVRPRSRGRLGRRGIGHPRRRRRLRSKTFGRRHFR